MKQRLTSEDIACLIPSLNKIIDGAYLVQVYDGSEDNTRSLVMKLRNKIDGVNKMYYLLLESGIRVHTIDDFSSIRPGPSGCASKIRKEVGDKRMYPIKQIGTDRSIDFLFSNEKHFIIELYDRGNFIITDKDYKIIYITRPYKLGDIEIDNNKIYPIDKVANSGPVLENDLSSAKGYIVKNSKFSGFPFESNKKIEEFDDINMALKSYFYEERAGKNVKVKKKKSRKGNRKANIENQINQMDKKEEKILDNAMNLEQNVQELQSIINLINTSITNKINFKDIEILIKDQYNYKSINLNHKNLILDNISIDYNISAYANVSKIFSQKKVIREKRNRAVEISKNMKPEKDEIKKEKLIVNRKEMKFENFWWFIKDDFVITCGKSADDNEHILSNVEPSDVLVHGHFDKSPWAVIKNPNKIEIPFKIIHYAGAFLVQRSWNWAENYSNNSYYTYPDKVSKSAPSGEYMGKGSRMVHEKNFLPNTTMEMGLGVIFRCGDKYLSKINKDTVIDYGMVTCAPYMVISDYDYKVKVRPSGKKSDKGRKKLLESAIKKILSTKSSHTLVKDYIRAIPFTEWDKICIRTFTL